MFPRIAKCQASRKFEAKGHAHTYLCNMYIYINEFIYIVIYIYTSNCLRQARNVAVCGVLIHPHFGRVCFASSLYICMSHAMFKASFAFFGTSQEHENDSKIDPRGCQNIHQRLIHELDHSRNTPTHRSIEQVTNNWDRQGQKPPFSFAEPNTSFAKTRPKYKNPPPCPR